MILDARLIVQEKIENLKERVNKLQTKPELVIIKVGNDKASERYVINKVKRCEEVGIASCIVAIEEDTTNEYVAEIINSLNKDERITGILLQLPLPKHLDEKYLTELIAPEKDVDGFTIANMGRLVLGEDGNVACTPYGIIELLKYYNIPIAGKDVLIINRSNIVGKPLAHMFLKEDATVTIAHSKTKDIYYKMDNSDIIVTAIGRANSFCASDFLSKQTIVDVSINFDANGKMCGDIAKCDYDELLEMGCNFTPVPNGVGQMTVLALIEQTIKIQEKKENEIC